MSRKKDEKKRLKNDNILSFFNLKNINLSFLLDFYESQLLDLQDSLSSVSGLYGLSLLRDHLTVMQSSLSRFLLDDRLPDEYRFRILDLLDLISSLLSDVQSKLLSSDFSLEQLDFLSSK